MDGGPPPDPSLAKLWVKLWSEKGGALEDLPCSPRTDGQLRRHGAADTEMRTKQMCGEDERSRRRRRSSCGDSHAGSDSQTCFEMITAHWWTKREGRLSAWVCAGLVPPLHGPVGSR